MIVFAVVLIFMRDRPEDIGLRPYGQRPDATRRAGRSRSRRFAALRLARPLAGVLDPGRHVLRVRRQHERAHRHAPDRRLPRLRHPADAVGAAARADGDLRHPRHDGVGMAHRSLFEPPPAVRLLHAARAVAAVSAVHAGRTAARGLGCFAVFYGLDWIATVPPTVRLTGEAFGRENTGVVYGWIGASHQLGASLAAFGAGAIRTVAGDYRLAFWIAGTLRLWPAPRS